MAQFVVVVEILVTQRDPEHPLTDQRRNLVLDQVLAPLVVKARRKPIDQSDRPIRRAQKQSTRIRAHQPAIKSRFHSPAFNGSKSKYSELHSVGIGAPSFNRQSRCSTTTF